MEEKMTLEQMVEDLEKSLHPELEAIAALVKGWRAGGRSVGELLPQLALHAANVVVQIGAAFPALADKNMRQQVAEALLKKGIKAGMDAAGVDIPFVPDEVVINLAVHVAVISGVALWRQFRDHSKAGK